MATLRDRAIRIEENFSEVLVDILLSLTLLLTSIAVPGHECVVIESERRCLLPGSLLGRVTFDGADNRILLSLDTICGSFDVTLGLRGLDFGFTSLLKELLSTLK